MCSCAHTHVLPICVCVCVHVHVRVHLRELSVVCLRFVLLLPARASKDIWALSAAGALP